MPNEFNIKNGFISQGNSIVNGSLTATTISATTISGNTFYGSGLGLTDIPISSITNLQTSLNNKFDTSGGTITGNTTFTTGVTINGNLTVTGNTILSSVTATTFTGDGSELTNVNNPSSKLFSYYNFI